MNGFCSLGEFAFDHLFDPSNISGMAPVCRRAVDYTRETSVYCTSLSSLNLFISANVLGPISLSNIWYLFLPRQFLLSVHSSRTINKRPSFLRTAFICPVSQNLFCLRHVYLHVLIIIIKIIIIMYTLCRVCSVWRSATCWISTNWCQRQELVRKDHLQTVTYSEIFQLIYLCRVINVLPVSCSVICLCAE